MVYHLAEYLNIFLDIPGLNIFQYISFRAIISFIISLLFTVFFGKRFILFFKKRNIIEASRVLGLESEKIKQKTPSMGGLIIISAILFSTFLLCDLTNSLIWLLITTTFIMGTIGCLDDYIKIFKQNKSGLSGKYKVYGQILTGVITSFFLLYGNSGGVKKTSFDINGNKVSLIEKNLETTLPFLKNNYLDYSSLFKIPHEFSGFFVVILFTIVCIFIISSLSNSVNLTDGLDGLATGNVAIVGVVLAIFAYITGNAIFSKYLLIYHIPDASEITIFIAAMIGACIGFLWYNSNPAEVFMGDTGSLTLGTIIAVTALAIKKELLLPLLCGVFLVETVSVIIQVAFFKFTKKKFGTGKRVFLMTPIHHHFQKKGWKEQKVVVRFWLIGLILAGLTLATIKIR